MICRSCQQEISEAAERCPHCEAETEPAPTGEEMAAVTKALADEGPELMAEFRDAFEKSADGEDFVNRVMIGDCPKCGSSETGDCEHDPEIDDVCVARCFTCGQLWCPDCGAFFVGSQFAEHDCPAWEDMDLDDDGPE